MKPIFISEVEIEIGDNLFLHINDLDFTPETPDYISGPPEDCYQGEGAGVDWKDENCTLIYRSKEYSIMKCPEGLSGHYYEEILEASNIKFEREYLNN